MIKEDEAADMWKMTTESQSDPNPYGYTGVGGKLCIYITALKPGNSYFVADYERSWEHKGFHGGEDIAVPIVISAKQ